MTGDEFVRYEREGPELQSRNNNKVSELDTEWQQTTDYSLMLKWKITPWINCLDKNLKPSSSVQFKAKPNISSFGEIFLGHRQRCSRSKHHNTIMWPAEMNRICQPTQMFINMTARSCCLSRSAVFVKALLWNVLLFAALGRKCEKSVGRHGLRFLLCQKQKASCNCIQTSAAFMQNSPAEERLCACIKVCGALSKKKKTTCYT